MAEIINATIHFLAARPVVFSVHDIVRHASLEGLEDAVEVVLKEQCIGEAIVCIDTPNENLCSDLRILDWIDPATGEVHSRDAKEGNANYRRYLGRRVVEKWWVDRSIWWAKTGVEFVSPAQLAGSMSLAFDERRWGIPPKGILDVGRRWAMVADGCVPGTLVFPWTMVLRVNPQFTKSFRSLFSSSFSELSLNADDIEIDQVLNCLPEREANIIRGRFGLDPNYPNTLEGIGELMGITRERVRQLELRALRARTELSFPVWLKFAAEFVQSGGSLLVHDPSSKPSQRLLEKVWKLNFVSISHLDFNVIATERELADFRSASQSVLRNARHLEQAHASAISLPPFLSHSDGILIRVAVENSLSKQVTSTRPLMLRQALRSLGRAAHYTEIAEECNRLYPERQGTFLGWHAALSLCAQPERESLGIVWIGRKGMYGLKEHGYSRPEAGLFEEVANIVEAVFDKTGRPASLEVVMAELSKKRRELSRNSVNMALSLNDKLSAVSRGRYVPKKEVQIGTSDIRQVEYDIAAAFQAFSADEEES